MAIPNTQRFIAILWPSFVMSGIATVVFFATFDPYEILAPTWFPNLSRIGAYSLGFLLFWLLTASTSMMTCFFLRPVKKPQQGNPPMRDIRESGTANGAEGNG